MLLLFVALNQLSRHLPSEYSFKTYIYSLPLAEESTTLEERRDPGGYTNITCQVSPLNL